MSKTTVMRVKKKKKANLCDVLGQHAKYVVFTKDQKLQVLREPKDKEIRQKIKKKWEVRGWVKANDQDSVLLKVLAKMYNFKEEVNA